VEIDVGFAIWVRQKLRLRGIDAPELSRRSGQRARAFVEERLALAPCIALCTSRADKYDRYLADVFYLEGEGDAGRVVEQGIYLNQQLLDQGLAARQDG
jgi:endonuclease YncB( thermonuclease family)